MLCCLESLKGGVVYYLSSTWPVLTEGPLTIAALSQAPLLLGAASILLPLSVSSPVHFLSTLLPKCLSTYTPGQ